MLLDPYKRPVSYLRVSVTDRCDFRCEYCMAENMTFLPKKDVLSLEELERICSAFIKLGTKKIRLTGGEPLVRKDLMKLIKALGKKINHGMLDELTLTTNGTQLNKYAKELYESGVKRINVSLDTLDPIKFKMVTRRGDLSKILSNINIAKNVGLKIKINTVALSNINKDEIENMMLTFHKEGYDFTIIETMPLGEISESRENQYLPLSTVRKNLEKNYTLTNIDYKTGGPARYVKVEETDGRLGFITPLTHNFCELCNRVRLTCTGKLFMCLGQNDNADFRDVLRKNSEKDLINAIEKAISRKPKGHDFVIKRNSKPALERHMSVTGG